MNKIGENCFRIIWRSEKRDVMAQVNICGRAFNIAGIEQCYKKNSEEKEYVSLKMLAVPRSSLIADGMQLEENRLAPSCERCLELCELSSRNTIQRFIGAKQETAQGKLFVKYTCYKMSKSYI